MSNNLNTLSASGSATGNPRNKTALKPGFSLVGWIRLGSSGADLNGFGGKTITVSHQELAKHNKPEDCWMAVRGKVYNVTRYLDFHPGGRDQLLRGAGKDATNLFDQYHAFVNVDQLLAKCFVGPLRNTVTLNLKDFTSNTDLKSKLTPLKLPSVLSISTETLSKAFASEKMEPPVPAPVETIPRFDWIQKTSELTLYFYTKSFCNPSISINNICDKVCEIKISIACTSNLYKFSFLKSLKWPCSIRNNLETGKIEITFEKVVPELWSNFGIFERTRMKEETVYNDYVMAAKNFFNHDSFELILRPKSQQLVVVPVGYHLNFRLSVLGTYVIRSYTPIPTKYITKEAIESPLDILFLIKTYNVGTLTKYLKLKNSEEIIEMSTPKGSFDLNQIKTHTKFAMFAAGSGITPIMSVIEYLLGRNSSKIDFIHLFYFNKTENDIWLKKQFDELQKNDLRLVVKHILSEPEATQWTGDKGRITMELVENIAKTANFAFVCGPNIFNEIASQLITECKLEMHCFQG